jgi:hypothetical protein
LDNIIEKIDRAELRFQSEELRKTCDKAHFEVEPLEMEDIVGKVASYKSRGVIVDGMGRG